MHFPKEVPSEGRPERLLHRGISWWRREYRVLAQSQASRRSAKSRHCGLCWHVSTLL